MKKIILATVLAALGSTSALAADLGARAPYAKAPAMMDAVANWTGFYVGLNVGGAWTQKDDAVLSLPAGPPQAFLPFLATGKIPTNYSNRASGVIAGAQLGYNWQVQNIVFGLETDISGSSLKGSQTLNTDVLLSTHSLVYSTKADYVGTVRARLGTLITPQLLAYLTGGFAYGQLTHSYSATNIRFLPGPVPSLLSTGSGTSLNTGWTVGGGLEWALTNNLTLRGEYLYVNLSGRSFTTPSNNGVCGVLDACSFTLNPGNLGLNIARLGVNYKLGGPVAAKY
jgi:outer membrane immunogenic protein